ncbi:zinc metalloprotease HtpX [Hyperthermus butylicus]|uniref:Protease HtpX homolog n=1 Tax=Hyperthermus butylicus (strain DSM 5456 / JCM 9403 / PLM1-5) TaxID=415426 RepID=A2BKW5_HYPBU|nr:zinc metalloprotease HtpX [Hyperthermus butylicus]ABM80626.1 putative peptidase [Hyperthermus butylicus DSM 5456]
MFLLVWDPLTFTVLVLLYAAGFLLLQLLAMRVAPRVAGFISSRVSLYTAMLITAGLIVGGGLIAIYAIYSLAASYGYSLPIGFLLAFLIVANLMSYLLAPYMINAVYRAKPDPELQRIVDEVASRAGVKPPKAVIVEGPPNAFAYGNFLTGRYIAVSRSLYEILPRNELEAVVGHEIGHHRHRDVVIIMLLGLVPSILYYMGVWLIRIGLWSGAYRSRREGNGGLALVAVGALSVLLSFIMQVAVLTFSRLREYYADAHGAIVAGARPMQRALARLHLYYQGRRREELEKSSLKALFIYALVEAAASPFYSYTGSSWSWRGDIDSIVERLKRMEVNPAEELFSDHPPIPKRLRFLDNLEQALGKARV